jgi:hypothetical protein
VTGILIFELKIKQTERVLAFYIVKDKIRGQEKQNENNPPCHIITDTYGDMHLSGIIGAERNSPFRTAG